MFVKLPSVRGLRTWTLGTPLIKGQKITRVWMRNGAGLRDFRHAELFQINFRNYRISEFEKLSFEGKARRLKKVLLDK